MWTYALLVDLSIVLEAIRTLAPHDDAEPTRLDAEAFVTSLVDVSDVLADGSLLRAYFFEAPLPTTGVVRGSSASGRAAAGSATRTGAGWTSESIEALSDMTQCKVRRVAAGATEDALCQDLASLAEHKACDAVIVLAHSSPRLLSEIDRAQLRGTLVHSLSVESILTHLTAASTALRHDCDSGRIMTSAEVAQWFLAPTGQFEARSTRRAAMPAAVASAAPVATHVSTSAREPVTHEAPRATRSASVRGSNGDIERDSERDAASTRTSPAPARASRRLPAYAEDLPGGVARFYGGGADFRVPDDMQSGAASGASAAPAAPAPEPFSTRDVEIIADVADHIASQMYDDERDEVRANGLQAIPAHVDRRLLGAAKRAFGTLLDAPLKKELRRQLWMRC